MQHVSGGRDQNAGTASLAPDTLIGSPELCTVVVAGAELLVLNPELPVKQVQLFDSRMAMGRIGDTGREPHEHADAILLRVRRQQLVVEAWRRLLPFLFGPASSRWHRRLLTCFHRDSARETIPQHGRRAQHIGRPGNERVDDRTKPIQFLPAIRTRGQMSLERERFARRKGPQGIQEHRFPVVVIRCSTHRPLSAPSSSCRSFASPERIRVFTVPSGWSSLAATSRYVSSEKNAVSMACRSWGVSASRACRRSRPCSLRSKAWWGPLGPVTGSSVSASLTRFFRCSNRNRSMALERA